ncbi:uncharacterized protein CTRU02_206189 [Colletotrichum truncatum]|uniref:Uncharacterized protein n=1 Tax=Colletotrichum truncatum TaxID=5467 RepID=A0ACC3Z662_COLTU|nr:uncharacterized protein CTRU02_10393 [Colletotrichum truncatum]KAF6787130.1 hypothetical protein CTRU02_10393 [Colletotrichum truncatum]
MRHFFFSMLQATKYMGGFMIWAFRSGSLWAVMATKHARYPAPFEYHRRYIRGAF